MPLLKERIKHAVRILRPTDKLIAIMLEDDGFVVGSRRVQRLRWELGLKKVSTAETQQEMEQRIETVVRAELEAGNCENYGYRMLWTDLSARYSIIGRYEIHNSCHSI